MKYVLKAKVVKIVDQPIEVEADSLCHAKELIEDAIACGEVEVDDNSPILNVEFEQECCSSPWGHRWDWSPHEKVSFCKHCGIVLEEYKAITL